jgi:hypothetical protein
MRQPRRLVEPTRPAGPRSRPSRFREDGSGGRPVRQAWPGNRKGFAASAGQGGELAEGESADESSSRVRCCPEAFVLLGFERN